MDSSFMPLWMGTRDMSSESVSTTTTELRRCSIYFLRPLCRTAYQVEFVGITALRTLQSQHGWNGIEDWDVGHIFGDRTSCVLHSSTSTDNLCRSVHNTRIERLWYDVTHGFGRKWKDFFWDLEIQHGLNVSFRSHKWLLRHLFLKGLNEDAQDWAAMPTNCRSAVRLYQ